VNDGTFGAGGFGAGDGGFDVGGGGAGMGGAIFNLGGTVNIANCTFVGNRAAGGMDGFGNASGGGFGGAVFNLNGTVKAVHSTFDGNTATVVVPPQQFFAREIADVRSTNLGGGDTVYNLIHAANQGVPAETDATFTVANTILVASQEFAPVAHDPDRERQCGRGQRQRDRELDRAEPQHTDETDVNGATFTGLPFVIVSGPVVSDTLADNGGPTDTLLPVTGGPRGGRRRRHHGPRPIHRRGADDRPARPGLRPRQRPGRGPRGGRGAGAGPARTAAARTTTPRSLAA